MNTLDFWKEVYREDPNICWEWGRAKSVGYGSLVFNGKKASAHRVAYESVNGPIKNGLHVLHSCDNRACCNPTHLSLGTNKDNIIDSVRKGRRKGITRNRPSGLKYKKDRKLRRDTWTGRYEEMRSLREKGYSYQKIGEIIGCGRHTAYHALNNSKWSKL
jgi:hypothetical protein